MVNSRRNSSRPCRVAVTPISDKADPDELVKKERYAM
jgi:hypothetical protein